MYSWRRQWPGAQWELGAVGNAEWTGVPLSVLLESAGLADDVCEIVLEGADRGIPKEEPKPPGSISYARSIPRARAMQPDVLIAYQMNGQDLTSDHGYPLRAIVPGYYGMSSVKWLIDIFAVTQSRSRSKVTGKRPTTATGMILKAHLCAGRCRK